MGWKFVLDNNVEVDLDQLPPALFDEIAANDKEASWYTVYRFPGATTDRLWRLYVEACKIVNQTPVKEPTTLHETLQLLDTLEQTTDIEDQPMENGYPPTQGAPENGSLSGAPVDSDGPLSSPENNPSEIC